MYMATCYLRNLIKKIMKCKHAVEEGTRQQLARMAEHAHNAPADPVTEDQAMRGRMFDASANSQLRNKVVVALMNAVSGEVMRFDLVFAFTLVGDVISKANGIRRHGGQGRAENEFEMRLLDDSLGRKKVADLLTNSQRRLDIQVIATPRPTVFFPEAPARKQ